jgi:ankyrin repeat protein
MIGEIDIHKLAYQGDCINVIAALGEGGCEKTRTILAEGGVDVNAADYEGTTPLHAACYGGLRTAGDKAIKTK